MKRKILPPVSEAARPTSEWQVQTAKARFSEVFRRARAEGPQRITRQGRDAVILVSEEEFVQLSRRRRQALGLVEFFAKSPLRGAGLDLERKPDYGRKVEL